VTATTSKEPEERTYGHWRLGRRPGLWGLDPVGTALAFGFMVLAASMLAVSTVVALWVAITGLVVLAPLMVRIAGRTGLQVLSARLAWWWGTSRRRHIYVSGIASRVSEAHRLPGILARSLLYEVETGRHGPIAVVVVPQSRHYTMTLRCETDGMDLVDRAVIDARVARLAAWLSALCREPMLAQAQITIETTPDPGTRLAEEVASTTRPDAPALARQVLDEVVYRYPAGSAQVDTRVSLTFTPPPGQAWKPEVMCREVAARLPHLYAGLTGTGVSGIRPMTAADLAATMRACYDPGAALELARDHDTVIAWEQAGPVAAKETWDSYRHDTGVSRTWGMVEAPRGTMFASTYSRLTEPDPELLRKRVSLIYRPYAPGEAARLVERDKRDAYFTAGKKHRATARDSVDVAAAEQTAAEEARGAGVVRFTVLVTATVADEAQLGEAERIIKARAGEARLHLRSMNGSQAAAFTAGLPAGVVLPVHASIPF